MNNIKMCVRCNAAIISNLHSETADYYRHLSVKYCDKCRKIVNNEQTAERMRRMRARNKAEKKELSTRLSLLEKENAILKQNIESYGLLLEYIEQARRELEA